MQLMVIPNSENLLRAGLLGAYPTCYDHILEFTSWLFWLVSLKPPGAY